MLCYLLLLAKQSRAHSPIFSSLTYVTVHSPILPSLYLRPTLPLLHLQPFRRFYLRHSSFSNSSVASPASQLILQPFRRFTYVTAHSPVLPPLHLRHSSFSNPSVALPMSQLILRTLLLLHLRHSSFSNPSVAYVRHSSFSNSSVASPTSQLILQPFRRFIYVTAHSRTLLLLHLGQSSFSNTSFASPTSQAPHLRHLASRPWFFHAPSNQSNLLFILFFFCGEITTVISQSLKVDAGLLLSRLQF